MEGRTGTSRTGAGGSTALPNALFDALLPTLGDTELRVLLVVARSTLGWKDGSGRKTRDWLSHAQLQKRTGRSGAPVSRAVDSLVKRGLLEIEDESGRPQHSARQRRALRSRLFFRLGNGLLEGALPYPSGVLAHHEGAQILPSPTNLESNDFSMENDRQQPSSLESGLHFVKTTKEKQTKDVNETLSSLVSKDTAIESESVASDEPAEDVRDGRFLALFERAFRAARPHEEMAAPDEEDLALLRHYFGRGYESELERWLPAFFACSFGFVIRRNYSLHAYLHCFFNLQSQAGSISNRTIVEKHRRRPPTPEVGSIGNVT